MDTVYNSAVLSEFILILKRIVVSKRDSLIKKKPKDRESKENSKTRDGRQNKRLGKIRDSLSGEERGQN